ncbi:MAG: putative DNA-binding domain-containing protein [Candidatus Binatia bacterium]
MSAPVLPELQRALARALTRPGGGADPGLLENVVPGGSLDAEGALGVYRRGYLARLTEQLGETFASVWRVLGDEDFFAACESYLAAHPSTSYNLSDYGRDFPDFLAASTHAANAPFLAELARFELAFHDLFHAVLHQAADAAELASLTDLEGVRFRLGSAMKLLACESAVYDLFRRRHDEEPPDVSLDRPQWMLLYRRGGDVIAHELEVASFRALEAIAAGAPVEEALARAVESDPAFGAAEAARLFELLAGAGLVVSVER